nr:MAG TPA: hypothetical protein [Caudoviricetes sp.]
MNIDIMMNNIILHNKLCCRCEILQHCKTQKFRKKIKKNRERADVYGCTGIEGAGVYLQRIAALV